MTVKEKILYHQIHPLKLTADIASGLLTTYLAWLHKTGWFLILFLLPSVIASAAVIKFADLRPVQESKLGRYVAKYMTHKAEAIRLLGQIIMWISAWYHLIILVVVGFLSIVLAWISGLLQKRFEV